MTHHHDPESRLLMLFPRLMHMLKRDRMRMHAGDPKHATDPSLPDRGGQYRLLGMLQRHQRLTIQGMADALEVSPPTVSRMIRDLAEHDLVSRERDIGDQRVVWITLTEAGSDVLDAERGHWRTIFAHRFEQLDAIDQALIRNAIPAFERLLETRPMQHVRKDA